MADASRVCDREALARLHHQIELVFERDARRLPQVLVEGGAFEQLHHDVEPTLVLADVQDAHDASVLDLRRESGFPEEPLAQLGLGGEIGRQDLQRDAPPEGVVVGPVHHAHGAATDPPEDTVTTDDGRRSRAHRLSHAARTG